MVGLASDQGRFRVREGGEAGGSGPNTDVSVQGDRSISSLIRCAYREAITINIIYSIFHTSLTYGHNISTYVNFY